jgi:hypothetical protein
MQVSDDRKRQFVKFHFAGGWAFFLHDGSLLNGCGWNLYACADAAILTWMDYKKPD